MHTEARDTLLACADTAENIAEALRKGKVTLSAVAALELLIHMFRSRAEELSRPEPTR